MRLRELLFASVAMAGMGLLAEPAQAQKAKTVIADNVIYTAEVLNALSAEERKAILDEQKLEQQAYSRIFRAAPRGAFDQVGEQYYNALISESLLANGGDVSVDPSSGDPNVFTGLDRFVGGDSNVVKFSVARFLPTLVDAQSGQSINGFDTDFSVERGKGGAKIQSISTDDDGNVTVDLKPKRGGYKHNNYVNLVINIDGVGRVPVTYWLRETRPNTPGFVLKQATFDDDGNFNAPFSDLTEDTIHDDGDNKTLLAAASGANDTSITNFDVRNRLLRGRSPTRYGEIQALVTDGKMLSSVFVAFDTASPSS